MKPREMIRMFLALFDAGVLGMFAIALFLLRWDAGTVDYSLTFIVVAVVASVLTSPEPEVTFAALLPSGLFLFIARLFYLESLRLGPPMLLGVPFFTTLGLLTLALPIVVTGLLLSTQTTDEKAAAAPLPEQHQPE